MELMGTLVVRDKSDPIQNVMMLTYWTGGGIQENRRNKCQRTDWKSDRLLPSTNHQKLAIIIATKLQKISSDANAHDYIYTYPDIEQDV